jgi:hypothetical protein
VADPVPRAHADNPEVRHEESDVNVKAITRFAIGLAAVLALILALLLALFNYFNLRERRLGRGPARVQTGEQLPPQPRLEVSPRAALLELRAAEQKLLEGYQWIDREKGIVRIPIERAMELTARRGLPARKQPGETLDDANAKAPR